MKKTFQRLFAITLLVLTLIPAAIADKRCLDLLIAAIPAIRNLPARFEARSMAPTQGGYSRVAVLWDQTRGAEVIGKFYLNRTHKWEDAVTFAKEYYLMKFFNEKGVPHIPKVFDAFSLAGEKNQKTPDFFTMEFIPGSNLHYAIRTMEKLPVGRELTLDVRHYYRTILGALIQVSDAVSGLHRLGYVHRDLKPANIVSGPNGSTTLLDFGISSSLDDLKKEVRQGSASGTKAYKAPEIRERKYTSVQMNSDVYSLGVILLEALTREDPPTDPDKMLLAVLGAPVGGPPAFEVLIRGTLLHALEKDPKLRYPNVEAFQEDLRAALAYLPE